MLKEDTNKRISLPFPKKKRRGGISYPSVTLSRTLQSLWSRGGVVEMNIPHGKPKRLFPRTLVIHGQDITLFINLIVREWKYLWRQLLI